MSARGSPASRYTKNTKKKSRIFSGAPKMQQQKVAGMVMFIPESSGEPPRFFGWRSDPGPTGAKHAKLFQPW